ncbi:MAG: hypothetical protein AAB651_00850 [Patescibacteria group bacterium]
MNPAIFRAYDIRGKYPKEINERVVSEIVQSIGQRLFFNSYTLNLKPKVVVGHDARLSSPKLYRAAMKALQDCKIERLKIIEAGMITTPMLSFLVNHYKADLGIMITASHNPKNYSGLKIVGKNAVPISGKEILKIISGAGRGRRGGFL